MLDALRPSSVTVDQKGLVALITGEVSLADCQNMQEPEQHGPLHQTSAAGIAAIVAEAGRMAQRKPKPLRIPVTPEREQALIALRERFITLGVLRLRRVLEANQVSCVSELSDVAVKAAMADSEGEAAARLP